MCPLFWMDRQTDNGKSKCSPLKWGHKIYIQIKTLCKLNKKLPEQKLRNSCFTELREDDLTNPSPFADPI